MLHIFQTMSPWQCQVELAPDPANRKCQGGTLLSAGDWPPSMRQRVAKEGCLRAGGGTIKKPPALEVCYIHGDSPTLPRDMGGLAQGNTFHPSWDFTRKSHKNPRDPGKPSTPKIIPQDLKIKHSLDPHPTPSRPRTWMLKLNRAAVLPFQMEDFHRTKILLTKH